MSVLLTGTFGRVGSAFLEHQTDSFNCTCFDRTTHSEYESIVGDVASYPDLAEAAEDVDDIVHLAAASRVDADWPSVLQSNVVGGYNCLEVAKRNSVDSVVLASTNHVMEMHEQERAPELYSPDYDWTAKKSTPVRPDSLYGSSKVFLEGMGRYYVENFESPERVYVLRIGSVRGPSEDHPYADAERDVSEGVYERGSEAYRQTVRRMKSTWQSRRDIASMIAACLDDDSVEYDVFYGVSDNDRRWMDIEHAKTVLGYEPADNGDEWVEPPTA
jgi:nucleoside-diphosphate-sugar epimerase